MFWLHPHYFLLHWSATVFNMTLVEVVLILVRTHL